MRGLGRARRRRACGASCTSGDRRDFDPFGGAEEPVRNSRYARVPRHPLDSTAQVCNPGDLPRRQALNALFPSWALAPLRNTRRCRPKIRNATGHKASSSGFSLEGAEL